MTKFSENLRRIRRAKDITQEELSRKTNIHQTHISHYERGERKPSFDNLMALSDALNCTLDELVKQG